MFSMMIMANHGYIEKFQSEEELSVLHTIKKSDARGEKLLIFYNFIFYFLTVIFEKKI